MERRSRNTIIMIIIIIVLSMYLSMTSVLSESPVSFFADTLRAMYMGDNDFEIIPPEIGQLKNLQIVSRSGLALLHLLQLGPFTWVGDCYNFMEFP